MAGHVMLRSHILISESDYEYIRSYSSIFLRLAERELPRLLEACNHISAQQILY